MVIDNVIKNIDRGKKGLNIGLYMGFQKLLEYVPGVQQETIYTIGGMTGSAKTAFALSAFCYNPYDDYIRRRNQGESIDLKILLYSFEMSKEMLLTKAVCRRIYLEHKLLIDVAYVLSRGKNRISQEVYDLVLTTRKYFEEFEDTVTIFGPENPTGIHKQIHQVVLQQGQEVTTPAEINDGGVKKVVNKFVEYKPHKDNSYIIPIIDHLSIMKQQQGYSVKQNIDKMSEYMISLTNKYGVSPVYVMQVNRNIEQLDRFKAGSIEVQLSDFRDSSDPIFSSHCVFGLNCPYRFEIDSYRGYNIKLLKDRFRSIKLLKSRDGVSDIVVGLAFIGEIGLFKELKPGKLMTDEDYNFVLKPQKISNNP